MIASRFHLAAAVLACLLLAAPQITAAVYVVNSTEDRPDADSLDGQCSAPVTGACTLRAAIMEANAVAGADTIVLPAGVYLLTRVAVDDTASGGDLDIREAVTIHGAGADETIVDGNGEVTSDRVVDVLQGATAILSGITIRGGKLPGFGLADRGGGIRATSATLTLERVRRGGLFLAAAEIMIKHSILIGNSAGVYGGGVYAESSTLQLANTVLRENSAERGGALAADLQCRLDMSESLIEHNTAAATGGGLWLNSLVAADVTRTEIISNTAANAAGVYTRSANGPRFTECRLFDNQSSGSGGGIVTEGALVWRQTLVDGNSAATNGGGVLIPEVTITGAFEILVENSTVTQTARNSAPESTAP